MHKSLIALVGAAAISIAATVGPAPANADCVGCAVGAGILGGVAAGAIIGSAIANSPPPGYYRAASRLLQATAAGLCLWGRRVLAIAASMPSQGRIRRGRHGQLPKIPGTLQISGKGLDRVVVT